MADRLPPNEVPLACVTCGNRDTIAIALPPCSAECGHPMQVEHRGDLEARCRVMHQRAIASELSADNWRRLAFEVAAELDAMRRAWLTCRALNGCEPLTSPTTGAAHDEPTGR